VIYFLNFFTVSDAQGIGKPLGFFYYTGGYVMKEKLYYGNISFGMRDIDENRLLPTVGNPVFIYRIQDPHYGLLRRFARMETVSVTKAKHVFSALNLNILVEKTIEILRKSHAFMKRTILIMATMILFGSSFCQSPVRQTQPVVKSVVRAVESELDMEIRRVMEKGINLEVRLRQVPAIATAFARRTDPQRARWLAALCYLKTLGTPFMPLDIAQIALAETGEFGLSGTAVSPKGAVGVWQLMPHRAMSHGYSPQEMKNDEKCAEAAVRELTTKLKMAKGNLAKAKRFYCGAGPEADAYEKKIHQFNREILKELAKVAPQKDKIKSGGNRRLS